MGARGRPDAEEELSHLMARLMYIVRTSPNIVQASEEDVGDPSQLVIVGEMGYHDRAIGLSSSMEVEINFGGAPYRLIVSRRNTSSYRAYKKPLPLSLHRPNQIDMTAKGQFHTGIPDVEETVAWEAPTPLEFTHDDSCGCGECNIRKTNELYGDPDEPT